MKGVYPSMGNGLRSKIWKWYDIFMVNEYMTSQLCCKCEKNLVNFRDKNFNYGLIKSYFGPIFRHKFINQNYAR